MNFKLQPKTQMLPLSKRDSKPGIKLRLICTVIAITLPSISALGSQPCQGQSISNANPLRIESDNSRQDRSTAAPPFVATAPMPSTLVDLFNSGANFGSKNQDTQTTQQREERPTRGVDNQRIDSIKERITLLKNLMNQGDSPSTPEQVALPTPPTDFTEEMPRPQRREPMANPETFQPSEILVNPPPLPKLDSPLVSKPISTIELGNSLFMIGRYEAAFRSYSQRLETKQAEDHWPRLATGCCQRQLMDFVDAELIFRQLANEVKAEGYLRDYATWNLDYIKHRQTASDDFKRLAAEFDSIKKEMGNE